MHPVMNDTKWDELRLGMYGLGKQSPRYRTRALENGYESSWDGEWYYHFRDGGYRSIEWVEIEVTSSEQLMAVQDVLASIHVPGERTPLGFKVYGYMRPGMAVDYVAPPDIAPRPSPIRGSS
jgi:hypothetical protein